MGLGTKNRQKQTADICKQHLREKYRDQRGLVEEFILEFDGARENCDVTRWDRFADIKDIKKEMLERLAGIKASDAGNPPHILGQNRTGKTTFVPVPDPWLTHWNRTRSTDHFSLRQMSIAYDQPLPVLIESILVELNILDHFVLDRCL
jgi:hypothetical protein